MKKNITINLFGQLYHIDEDAYELLQKYEANMRRYFSNKDGGEEIIDDIEHRIAELLTELQAQGNEAIDITQIELIIHRIGNPEEISEENEDEENEKGETTAEHQTDTQSDRQTETPRPQYAKRLYRDTQDAMLGGVTSGIAQYFGIQDPILLRLFWVILFFVSVSTALLVYILLWIIIPPATTPEQRLQMCGKPVNPQTLNEELLKEAQQYQHNGNQPPKHPLVRFLNAVLSFSVFLLKVFLLFIGGGALIILFLVLIAFITFLIGGPGFSFSLGNAEMGRIMSNMDMNEIFLVQTLQLHTWQFCTILAGILVICGFPAFLLLRRLVQRDYRPSSTKARICYLIIWLAAIAISVGLATHTAFDIHHQLETHKRESNTRNNIYLTAESWAFLEENYWHLIQLQNTWEGVTRTCEHMFYPNHYKRYLSFVSRSHSDVMKCQVERQVDIEPGIYRLEAIVNTNGEGCCLYHQDKVNGERIFTPIPFTNDSTIKIKNMPWNIACQHDYFTKATDAANWQGVQERSNQREWCFIQSEPFQHDGGTLRYGITNDTQLTHRPWTGNKFAVYDMVVRKVNAPKSKR